MAKLASLDFEALSPLGENYLNWKIDAALALRAQNLHDTISTPDEKETEKNARSLMLLRKHIHPDLKNEYLTVGCPAELWKQLAERFHHLELITLPAAREEWRTLRFQDFKTVAAYNAKLLSITSRLELCKEPVSDINKIDRTLSTFHLDNVILQQQYRGLNFTSYNQLMQVLYMAEKQNDLLMHNHLSRPTGAAPLPEANHSAFGTPKGNPSRGAYRGRGRGRGQGNDGGRGRGRGHYTQGRGGGRHQQWHGGRGNYRGKGHPGPKPTYFKKSRDPSETAKDECFQCGKPGHWSRKCKASKAAREAYKKTREAENHHMTWAPTTAPPTCKGPMYPFMDFDDYDDLDDNMGNAEGTSGMV